MFPTKITFPSDNTEAELVEVIKDRNKGNQGKYKYLTGYYFKDKEIIFSVEDIERMKKKEIIK